MIANKYSSESQFEQKEENGENEEREASSLVAGDRGRKDSSTSRVAKKVSWTSYKPVIRGQTLFSTSRIFHSASQIIDEIFKSFKNRQKSTQKSVRNLFDSSN